MKKAISIALLSVFLFNSVGHYLVFKAAQSEVKKQIKREIKQGIDADELTPIRFALSETDNIHWIKKEKEFIHKDQMYDIVKTSVDPTHITYYCINDKQEKKLFEHLEEDVSKQLENNKNTKGKTAVKTDYFEEPDHVYFPISTSFLHLAYQRSYISAETRTATPPPRI